MQAAHDIMEMTSLMNFDHFSFPGVVPRTFLGPLILSTMTLPVHLLLQAMGGSKFLGQYLTRGLLGFILWLGYIEYAEGIKVRFKSGQRIANLCTYLTAIQFHLPFYMSRTLPNTFALFGCLVAYAQWFKGKPVRCLCILAVFMIIFRCDLLVLLAPLVIEMLVVGEIPFISTLLTGVIACMAALVVTVGVDSYFWRRGWLWPEGVVLFFNTVQNKSEEWGVSPWHWYLTSAIPRALNVAVIFAFVGLTGARVPHEEMLELRAAVAEKERRSGPPLLRKIALEYVYIDEEIGLLWYYISPAIIFVALYSLLPHKELRFVFPALPLLNLAAAKGLLALLGAQGQGDSQALNQRASNSASSQFLRKFLRRVASWGARSLLFAGIVLYFIFFSTVYAQLSRW